MRLSTKLFLTIIAFTAMVLSAAYVYSINNLRNNGFTRTYLESSSTPLFAFKVQQQLKDICGINGNMIYLSTELPGQIITVNFEGAITEKNIVLQHFKKPIKTIILDSDIYFASGNSKTICTASLSGTNVRCQPLPGPLFSRICMLGKDHFLIRQFSDPYKEQVFAKRSLAYPDSFVTQQITAVFHDGGVLTDGMMEYYGGEVLYTYYHKGAYLLLDTNLHLLLTGKTVDTFRAFHGTAVQGKKDKSNAGMEDFKSINAISAFNGKYLIINSNIKADNETITAYKENSELDIYDPHTATYLGSIQLPKINGKNIKAMKIYAGKLIVLYPDEIAQFSLPPALLFN